MALETEFKIRETKYGGEGGIRIKYLNICFVYIFYKIRQPKHFAPPSVPPLILNYGDCRSRLFIDIALKKKLARPIATPSRQGKEGLAVRQNNTQFHPKRSSPEPLNAASIISCREKRQR
jgi:hypothetical protein